MARRLTDDEKVKYDDESDNAAAKRAGELGEVTEADVRLNRGDTQTPGNPAPTALDVLADAMDRMTRTMEMLAHQRQQSPGDSKIEALIAMLAPALERMADSNLAGAKLITEEQRRSHRPSNEFVHQRSAFNRRGVLLEEQHPEGVSGPTKPPLKCLMLLPWLAEWESMTREEVELLNLLEPGSYIVKRIDNSRVELHISMEKKVDGITPSRLLMNHETAFNNDNKGLMPALTETLRQVLRQHPLDIARAAAGIMSDEEEEALIEAGELVVSV